MSENSNNEKSIINLNEDDDENENEKTLSPKINREPIKISKEKFNTENSDVGFALLRGANWVYCIKKLHCIIGRRPMKYNRQNNPYRTTWDFDVDLGPVKKVSKQHALILYNFQIGSFEIKNISKKFTIKVNGEIMNYNEEMPLLNKSVIVIGNQEFYFLLPD